MARDEDKHEARLEEAWGRLVQRLTLASTTDPEAAKRVKWLRRDVVNRYRCAATSVESTMVDQAQALAAWLVDSLNRRNSPDPLQVDWQQLRGDCEHLVEKINGERSADRSLLLGLLKATKDIEPLLDEVRAFLDRCLLALGSVQRYEPLFRAEQETVEIERRIDARIDGLPADWPSVRLARFQVQMHERNRVAFAHLLEELAKAGASSFVEWRAALAEPELGVPPEAHAVLVVLRGLIQVLIHCPADAPTWSEVAILARELLAPLRMQAELVRDANQPPEWFEPPVETEVSAAHVEQVGLAIRSGTGSWVCFPKGKIVLPLPVAEAPILEPPPLEGFVDLEAAASVAPPLAARLKQWYEAALDNTLETAAVQTYVDWWGELGEEWRERDPDQAAMIADRLQYVLQHGYKLFPFSPATFQEYPDGWVQRAAGNAMVTGRVRRVIRPGLHDDQNHLRVPALVEVE
jgi:hypothetical protein